MPFSPATAGADFNGTPYIVQFSDFNSAQSLSSVAEVEIINDTMAEFTESFVCVVSTPDGEDRRGIVAVDPNNVTISIEDNGGEWVCQVGVADILEWVWLTLWSGCVKWA